MSFMMSLQDCITALRFLANPHQGMMSCRVTGLRCVVSGRWQSAAGSPHSDLAGVGVFGGGRGGMGVTI